MKKDRILSPNGFKYYDSYECDWPFWYPIQEFLDIAEQIINGGSTIGKPIKSIKSKKTIHIIKTQDEAISGNKPNSPSSIYNYINQSDSEKIYVGISGGINALRKMKPDKIKKSTWYVCYKNRGDNWVSDDDFVKIYEEKMGISK